MNKTEDTYKTISKPSEETLFKDRGSKFYGYAFPIKSEEDIKYQIENLKKQHHSARHWCYAYQLGTETIRYRANDDGEPNNSAGMPIYGQIQSFEVTNVLVVVVRYFGGTKLGVGGLINAYKTAAQMALEQSQIIEKTINSSIQINFEYKHMSWIMRIIKELEAKISSQQLDLDCKINVSIRKSKTQVFLKAIEANHEVRVKLLS